VNSNQKKLKKPSNTYLFLGLSFILLVNSGQGLIFPLKSKIPQTDRIIQPNILLITLDTTRADHLGCYGYKKNITPHIDFLAQQGLIFLEAYTPVPLTLPSHCSILTGLYPSSHQVHNNGLYQLQSNFLTLAEILKKEGYLTAAFVSSFTLDSRFGLDQGFDYYDDQFNENQPLKNFRSERKAAQVYQAFQRWFNQRPQGKFFCWIHFFDPHLPYNPPPPFQQKFSKRPYDGEIAYMDFYIGKIIDLLEKNDLLEKTVIILVGDHGEALGDKKEIDHGLFLYNSTLKVPLILFTRGNWLPSKKVVKTRVRTIDIFPTILEICQTNDISSDVQGQSLLPLLKSEKNKHRSCYLETFFPYENFGWAKLTGFIQDNWKLINAPLPELYNLENDPAEKDNLVNKNPLLFQKLKKTLKKYLSPQTPTRKTRHLSLEEERKLRSLGYLASTSPSKNTNYSSLPDPKVKINDYLLFYKGNLYENSGKFSKAIKCFREVLRRNPRVANYYVTLGFLFMKMNQSQQAIKILEEGYRLLPHSRIILSRLIYFHSRVKQYQRALHYCYQLLQIDPDNFDALFLGGSLLASQKKWLEALDFYQKALKIEPENKILRRRYAYALAAAGRIESSFQEYNYLQKKYPHDFQLLKEIGEVHYLLGDSQKALNYLERSLALKLTPETCFLVALVQAKLGHLHQAIKWMKTFLEIGQNESPEKIQEAKTLLEKWQDEIKNQP